VRRGDESAAILPDTVYVKHCRRACSVARGRAARVSAGVTTWPGGDTESKALLRRADALGYDARASSRHAVRNAVDGAAHCDAAARARHTARGTDLYA
jgi:hypothetical protein